jgi:GNAT superfamily N-acetyltransferase
MAEAALKTAPTAAAHVVLRAAIPADTREMIELVRIAIGHGSVPRTEAFWRWKHEHNPFGPSPAMVADAAGRIVSLRIFLRWRWRHGRYAYSAVRPVDTATHPDWRRRGLFERLTRQLLHVMKAEGVAFVFNTPNTTSGRGYEKLGWSIVGRPTIWVRPLRPARLLAELARRQARRGLDEAPQRLHSTWFDSTSTEALSSPDLAGFVRNACRSTSHLTTDADAAYLGWRYRDCPGLAYGATGAFDRASGALAIFRSGARQGLRELRLCDLFVADDRASRRKARELLRDLARAHEADLVTARAVPGTPEVGILLRSGFIPVRRLGSPLAIRPLAEGAHLPPIAQLSAWGASIGDLEVF